MLQGLLAILLIIIVVMAIVVMFVIRFFYRAVSRLRDAARSAMGMDAAYDDRSRDNTGRRSRQYAYNGRTAGRHTSSGRTGNARSDRRTQTASGITIIDNRDPERARRKIFADDEGEYVDFKEE